MMTSVLSFLICLLSSTTSAAFQPAAFRGAGRQNLHGQRSVDSCDELPHLAFMGGGIFFYWQAGVVSFLRDHDYDLTQTSARGASAGGLCCTLTACDVDFYKATDLALCMAKEAGVWDRSQGLQGIWGPMIRDWLNMLLPDDAASRMHQRRTSLLVTPIPSFGKKIVSTFKDKSDVIDCNMASVHLPWFLDGELTSSFRGHRCIDGSFLSNREDYLPEDNGHRALFLSHQYDERYNTKSLLSFVETVNPDGIYRMIEDGKRYAKAIEEKGALEHFRKLPTSLEVPKI